MRKIVKLFSGVKKIIDNWEIPPDKWAIGVAAAMEAGGYKVEHPLDDIDLIINRSYVPWPISRSSYRILPPPHSRHLKDLLKFYKLTNYPIDIAVVPYRQLSASLIDSHTKRYSLANGKYVNIFTPEGDCLMRLALLKDKNWFLKWGVERIGAWKKYENNLLKHASNKKNVRLIKLCKKVLISLDKHLFYLKDQVVKSIWQGTTAYPGKIRGQLRLVQNLRQVKKVRTGEILVAPAISQRWLPYITKVKAIVVTGGGIVGHIGIIAREFKIPTIVNCHLPIGSLQNKDVIEVDATKGMVKKIK